MKTFIALVLFLFSSPLANAGGPWKVEYQNIKLPSQSVMEHDSWASPIVGATNSLAAAAGLNNGSATTLSITSQPDYPRNVTLTTGGTTASIGAGSAIVSGTNILGQAITESIAISATQAGTSTGSKAFKSVSSVLFPATSGAGATVAIGVGTKLGLKRCADRAGDYVFSEFNSAYETTRGTLAVSSSAIESNTFIPNGTMDGTKRVDLFYVQNYRCF